MNRAFLNLAVRSVDEDQRLLRGVATTGDEDRIGDTIDPLGCEWRGKVSLLWQHLHDQPVGTVSFGTATAAGVPFVAHIPRIAEHGRLKDRTDDAWLSAKTRIVTHVSVGFRPLSPPKAKANGALHYPAIEILELSLVSVAANPAAVIAETKAARRDKRVNAPAHDIRASHVVRLSSADKIRARIIKHAEDRSAVRKRLGIPNPVVRLTAKDEVEAVLSSVRAKRTGRLSLRHRGVRGA